MTAWGYMCPTLPIKQFQKCRDPGSNRGPSDLQSDALQTELSRQMVEVLHILSGELPEMFWMAQENMLIPIVWVRTAPADC